MPSQNTIASPFGSRVTKESSIVELRFPFASVRGTLRSTGEVYFPRRGKQQVRRWVKPHYPATALQLTRQEAFQQAVRHWSSEAMSDAQRKAWLGYALSKLWPECTWKCPSLAGMNGFRAVHVCRLAIGMDFSGDPPTADPPPLALKLTQQAAPNETSFGFRLEHGYEVQGAYVLVEVTPEMPTLRRRPCENQYGWACVEGWRNFLPLAPSGACYLIEGSRHAVGAGKRYGLRVTLVSPEGVPGETLTCDFVKEIGSEDEVQRLAFNVQRNDETTNKSLSVARTSRSVEAGRRPASSGVCREEKRRARFWRRSRFGVRKLCFRFQSAAANRVANGAREEPRLVDKPLSSLVCPFGELRPRKAKAELSHSKAAAPPKDKNKAKAELSHSGRKPAAPKAAAPPKDKARCAHRKPSGADLRSALTELEVRATKESPNGLARGMREARLRGRSVLLSLLDRSIE